jgi:hypothetical protein
VSSLAPREVRGPLVGPGWPCSPPITPQRIRRTSGGAFIIAQRREREPSPPPQRRLCDWAVYYYTLTGQHRCCYWNLLCSEAFFLEYPPITTTINVLRIIHYEAEVHGLDYSDCHDEHDLPIACMIPPHISSLRHGESRQIRSLRQHSHSFI